MFVDQCFTFFRANIVVIDTDHYVSAEYSLSLSTKMENGSKRTNNPLNYRK